MKRTADHRPLGENGRAGCGCARRSGGPGGPGGHRAGGFTIVELMITVSVIVVLTAILLPALGKGLSHARAYKCQMSLRGVAFDFAVFADPVMHGPRGDDSRRSDGRFSLETFQESQYGIDEFWPKGDSRRLLKRPKDSDLDPMRCSEMKGEVTMRRGVPCRSGAVGPAQNISYGFNARLWRAEVRGPSGRYGARDVQLSGDVLSHGTAPLAWDVDGEEAARRGVLSVFSAPTLESRAVYANDLFWWPGKRHGGRASFALIDGSVHTPLKPLDQPGWQWSYQPRP